ncbi:MAG: hypothetical protein ACLR4A_16590 [Christensenellales bacterium]
MTARVVSTSSFVHYKACFRFFGALGIANVDKNGISKSRHFDMNQTFFGITGQQTADSQGLERKLETLRQSYAEQAPRLIPLRDELLKLSQVQHNVDLLLREREERHHSEISR